MVQALQNKLIVDLDKILRFQMIYGMEEGDSMPLISQVFGKDSKFICL